MVTKNVVKVTLEEVVRKEGEKKLGRYGRTNVALDKEKEKLAALANRVKTEEAAPQTP